MLPSAILFITLALVFYTIGVWGEKIQGILKKWHLGFFYAGLICDTSGTYLMSQLSEISNTTPNPIHSITGLLAIVLMLLHAVWATYILYKKDQVKINTFHKFSIFVWLIWLVPYLTGMFLNMV